MSIVNKENFSAFVKKKLKSVGKTQVFVASRMGLAPVGFHCYLKRGALPVGGAAILAEELSMPVEDLMPFETRRRARIVVSPDGNDINIAPLLCLIVDGSYTSVTLEDVRFLMTTEKKLGFPLTPAIVVEVLAQRKKSQP